MASAASLTYPHFMHASFVIALPLYVGKSFSPLQASSLPFHCSHDRPSHPAVKQTPWSILKFVASGLTSLRPYVKQKLKHTHTSTGKKCKFDISRFRLQSVSCYREVLDYLESSYLAEEHVVSDWCNTSRQRSMCDSVNMSKTV